MTLALLIPGGHGQVGTDVALAATARGWSAQPLGSAELDITDGAAVAKAVTDFADRARAEGRRGVVINCAAYTAVDAAESDVAGAEALNVRAPQQLALAAHGAGLGFQHLSTDYVFPGDAQVPYEVDDPTGPRSVYGRTKLDGEQAVRAAHPGAFVVRTAWVYGAHGRNRNFVKTMAMLEGSRDTVSVVDDQRGSPTWSAHLAEGLLDLAALDPQPGRVLHATGSGETTWFGFTQAIFEELGADPARVLPTSSADFVRPAPRPAYSVLSSRAWAALGLAALPDWRSALHDAFVGHAAAFRA